MYVVNCLEEGTEKERGAEGRDGEGEGCRGKGRRRRRVQREGMETRWY